MSVLLITSKRKRTKLLTYLLRGFVSEIIKNPESSVCFAFPNPLWLDELKIPLLFRYKKRFNFLSVFEGECYNWKFLYQFLQKPSTFFLISEFESVLLNPQTRVEEFEHSNLIFTCDYPNLMDFLTLFPDTEVWTVLAVNRKEDGWVYRINSSLRGEVVLSLGTDFSLKGR
jgi:hypothetical protein